MRRIDFSEENNPVMHVNEVLNTENNTRIIASTNHGVLLLTCVNADLGAPGFVWIALTNFSTAWRGRVHEDRESAIRALNDGAGAKVLAFFVLEPQEKLIDIVSASYKSA